MCDTLMSLHPAALPVFCTLGAPWSVRSFHRSLEHLRRRTTRRKRRRGTESESSFFPATLKSEPSPSYCFVLKSSLPNADNRNGNGKNGSIKTTESSTGRADVSINVTGTLRNAECGSGINPGSCVHQGSDNDQKWKRRNNVTTHKY